MVDKKFEGIQLVARILAIVSGIIVLAIIVDKLKVTVPTISGVSADVCFYQASGTETCDFGIGMGAVSLVVGLILSVVNVLALVLPGPLALIVLPGGRRRTLALIDLGLSLVIAAVWFACAIYTTVEYADLSVTADEPNAGVFFTWLSFALWLVAGLLAIAVYKKSDTILPGDN
ncbi:uncharacterized protein LOC135829211 [Sycon ciliatum]|uniref:uncharacterized protein LOC135829211 n=1 Tax=Sycon ciliatum TaxID=27933 RepID=UPI0031F648D9